MKEQIVHERSIERMKRIFFITLPLIRDQSRFELFSCFIGRVRVQRRDNAADRDFRCKKEEITMTREDGE